MKPLNFESLFESIPGVNLILSPEFKIIAVSNDYLVVSYAQRQEIIEKIVFEIFCNNPTPILEEATFYLKESLQEVLKNKIANRMATYKFDIKNKVSAFDVQYWKLNNQPILNNNNEIEYIICHLEEVTDTIHLENNEKKLPSYNTYNTDKKFQSLIENSSDIISLMDENFKVIYRSPSAYRVTGFTNEEMLNMDGTKHIHPEDIPYAKNIVKELFENPAKQIKCKFRNQHKNGTYLWLEGTVINLLHDEQINAIVFNFKDISNKVADDLKINKINNLYAFISQINQNIVRIEDETLLFKNSCKIAYEFGKFKMAWIGLFDADYKKINLVEQFGISDCKYFLCFQMQQLLKMEFKIM